MVWVLVSEYAGGVDDIVSGSVVVGAYGAVDVVVDIYVYTVVDIDGDW